MAKKDPRVLIREGRKEIRSMMQGFLETISADLINRITVKAKKAKPSEMVNVTKNIELPKGQVYTQALREAMAVIVREAINIARSEVPAKVKFSEFDDLPPGLKRFLQTQAAMYVQTQIEDLNKKLRFKYQDTLPITDNVDTLTKELSNEAAVYISSTPVVAASGKFVSTSVNTARKAYFDNPEVMEKIEAFQYINVEPNAAICKDLKNHVFRADDPDLDKFTPPFHFNCDGWLRPILVGKLKDRKPDKYTPTKAAQKSIQFQECCGLYFAEIPDSFNPPQRAIENAKRGLELKKKWKRGGTAVGVARARDLSNGRSISRDTVGRMAAFNRHRKNSDSKAREKDGGPTAGYIAWLLWGGDAGVDWAMRIMDQVQSK